MRLSDFKTHDQALKVADDIVAQNKKDIGHDEKDMPHENPLLVRVFYIHGQGKKRTWSQSEKKELQLESDLKNVKQLGDASMFIEGMGVTAGSSSAGGENVKVEHVTHAKMTQQKDSLRSLMEILVLTPNRNNILVATYALRGVLMISLSLCRTVVKQLAPYPAQLASLKARMAVKGSKEPLYQKYVREISTMVSGLNEFLERCEMAIAQVEAVATDTADDKECEEHRMRLEGLCTTGEHHLGGAKSAKSRFAAM